MDMRTVQGVPHTCPVIAEIGSSHAPDLCIGISSRLRMDKNVVCIFMYMHLVQGLIRWLIICSCSVFNNSHDSTRCLSLLYGHFSSDSHSFRKVSEHVWSSLHVLEQSLSFDDLTEALKQLFSDWPGWNFRPEILNISIWELRFEE